MNVLHVGLLHCTAFEWSGRGVEVFEARPTLLRRLLLAHSPARGHLCAVSVRWSRQKVW
jgi:hypothetical protein